MGIQKKTTPSWIRNKRAANKKLAQKKFDQLPDSCKEKLNKEKFAEKMRFAPTLCEAKLHNAVIEVLKDTKTEVSIQHVIGPYIADMKVKNLIVEIDGFSHVGQEAYDTRRTSYIQNNGYRVVRFTNREVLSNAIDCAKHIRSLTEPHQHRDEEVKITYCPPSRSFPNNHKKTKRHFIIGWSA